MARICLTLPTNRACAATIAAVHEEAAHAAARFGVEVHFLVLDSAAERDRAGHAAAVAGLPPVPGVVVHHLGEAEQRTFLTAVLRRARVAGADKRAGTWSPTTARSGRTSHGSPHAGARTGSGATGSS